MHTYTTCTHITHTHTYAHMGGKFLIQYTGTSGVRKDRSCKKGIFCETQEHVTHVQGPWLTMGSYITRIKHIEGSWLTMGP